MNEFNGFAWWFLQPVRKIMRSILLLLGSDLNISYLCIFSYICILSSLQYSEISCFVCFKTWISQKCLCKCMCKWSEGYQCDGVGLSKDFIIALSQASDNKHDLTIEDYTKPLRTESPCFTSFLDSSNIFPGDYQQQLLLCLVQWIMY